MIDPRAQNPHIGWRKCAVRRHLLAAITIHQLVHKLAPGALARDDDGPVITTAKSILPQVKTEPSLLCLGPVAGITMLSQQWSNVFLIINFPPGCFRKFYFRAQRQR